MSKGQKGNKENKKAKADKNRVKNVSAYKAAQSLGKTGRQPVRKKDLTPRRLGWAEKTGSFAAAAMDVANAKTGKLTEDVMRLPDKE